MKSLLLAGLAALTLSAQPGVQRFTLPNGLQVLHIEDHEQPLVRARLHLRLEPGDTPPGKQGIAPLVLRMFNHSDAAELKAEDFDRLLEESGLLLSQSSTPGGLTWQLVARSRDQDRGLGLLADRLLRTVFDPAVLAAQRQACWLEEARPGDPPRARLRRMLMQDPAAQPSLSSLGAITLADLAAFRAKVFRPDRAVLLLHGDVGLEQAKRMVLLSLGTWTAQPAPRRPSRLRGRPPPRQLPLRKICCAFPRREQSSGGWPWRQDPPAFRPKRPSCWGSSCPGRRTSLPCALISGMAAWWPPWTGTRAPVPVPCSWGWKGCASAASRPRTWIVPARPGWAPQPGVPPSRKPDG